MTPDERLQQIEQGWNKPYDCNVCLGLSPSWDGHDRSCRGRVWESVPWLLTELRDARAENDELRNMHRAVLADGYWLTEQEKAAVRADAAEVKLAEVEQDRTMHEHRADVHLRDRIAAEIKLAARQERDRTVSGHLWIALDALANGGTTQVAIGRLLEARDLLAVADRSNR